MLAISPLRSNKDGKTREGDSSSMEPNFCVGTNDEFPDFSGSNLLDSIDFDDLFMGMHNSDGLPDLEMDPELLAEFSLSGEDESSTMSVENVVSPNSFFDGNIAYVLDGHESAGNNNNNNNNNTIHNNGCATGAMKMENVESDGFMGRNLEEVEIESKKNTSSESDSVTLLNSSSFIEKQRYHKKHRSSNITKIRSNDNNINSNNNDNNNINNHGKRKTKVDWTPELHRRFVQAVEQLGVDKAVPSRILELMGIDCLTRHNIASHLQKYRSHRKHLQAREAEAASWTQKKQMYGVAMGSGGAKGVININPWPHPPTIGFPPMTAAMHHGAAHSFRPFHVWGHPSMDPHARLPMWPKHVVPPPTVPLSLPWAPHTPPPDPNFWQSTHHHRRVPIATVSAVAVPGIPPHHVMYKTEHGPPPPQSGPSTPLDSHPSKESVDAALGDVLAKPWLPLPIGLKAPSMDSVIGELQRQGVSKIPPLP